MDLIARDLLKAPSLLKGVIDECFGTSYKETGLEDGVEFLDTSSIQSFLRFDEINADTFFKIGKERYHIEVQTLKDISMAIRVFEYGFYLAKATEAVEEDGTIDLTWPNQAVIFLEENKNIKDVKLKILFSNGEQVMVETKTIRLWEYGIEDLIEKEMYALIPLTLIKHRKQLKTRESEKKEMSIRRLVGDIQSLCQNVDVLRKNKKISLKDMDKLLVAIYNVFEYYEGKFIHSDTLKEEVSKMTKTFYDEAVEERAKIKGKIEGKIEGKVKSVIVILESKGKLSVEQKELIESQTEEGVLDTWLVMAATNSIEDFFKLIQQ